MPYDTNVTDIPLVLPLSQRKESLNSSRQTASPPGILIDVSHLGTEKLHHCKPLTASIAATKDKLRDREASSYSIALRQICAMNDSRNTALVACQGSPRCKRNNFQNDACNSSCQQSLAGDRLHRVQRNNAARSFTIQVCEQRLSRS